MHLLLLTLSTTTTEDVYNKRFNALTWGNSHISVLSLYMLCISSFGPLGGWWWIRRNTKGVILLFLF